MKQLLLLTAMLLLAGCTSRSYFGSRDYHRSAQNWSRTLPDPAPPHDRPMFIARGRNAGELLHWPALYSALDWAHIVVLGERHNDQVGHDTKTEIISLWDGPAVVAMEQFSRDQQIYLDDWRLDIGVTEERSAYDILQDRTTLWPQFEERYLPFISVAKSRGWPLVGSNAPRQYVRLARTDGYAALRHLSPEQRRMFDIPRTLPTGEYRDRFNELMSGMNDHGGVEIDVEDFYRSQVLWDTSMSSSVLRAKSRYPGSLVFHVNGAFHSDDDGGIVAMLRRALPNAHILNISLVPKDGPALEETDYGLADIVIYTGEIEEPEMPETMPSEGEEGEMGGEGEETEGEASGMPPMMGRQAPAMPDDAVHDAAEAKESEAGIAEETSAQDDPDKPAHPPIDLPEK